MKKLVVQLRQIETRENLQREVPRLKKQFNKLADLLVEARAYGSVELEPTIVSEELFAEMARLYEMSGCRELIESAQEEAVHRLR